MPLAKAHSTTMPFALALLLTAAGCGGKSQPHAADVPDSKEPGDARIDTTAGHDADVLQNDLRDGSELPEVAASDIFGPDPALCGGNTALQNFSAPDQAQRWHLWELHLNEELDSENPYDPEKILVTAQFLGPDGARFTIPGFWYQPYVRTTDSNQETLTAEGTPHWVVRFAPPMAGSWRWFLTVQRDGDVRCSAIHSLSVAAAPSNTHGYLKRADQQMVGNVPRYLAFDDGTPYFAIGQNVGWYDGGGTLAYDRWFGKMAENDANYARLWMASWGFGLETWDGQCTSPQCSRLGNYEERQDRAWQLDYVFQLAEEKGIYLMLCMLNHGLFSTQHNSEWEVSPWRNGNGGFLDKPEQFFTDPKARSLFKQRLTYIVARWGYSRHLLAWELFNEVDLTDQKDPAVLADWHQEMARFIKQNDPYGHLVTTSTASLGALIGIDQALYALPEIDLTQFHLYGREGFSIEFATQVPKQVGQNLAYERPVLAGEVGVHFGGPNETLATDPNFVGFHDILWVPVVSGAWGTGMGWWWDNVVDPQDLYGHFAPVAQWVSGVDFGGQTWTTWKQTVAGGTTPVTALALLGTKTALLWAKNSNNQYYQPLDDSLVKNVSVTLSPLPDGIWQATWIATWGGQPAPSQQLTSVDGKLQVTLPDFTRDVALRLVREE